MDDPATKAYLQLCEMASIETDPEKLVALVEEISRMLSENEERLAAMRKGPSSS